MQLTLDEITDDRQFEDLTASLLRNFKNNTTEITVQPSGIGQDGGRDILVTFRVNDGLCQFDRRWVIQCKFHNAAISTNEIADINIPSLIHSYKADGYLLVCKTKPTSKLTNFIENLKRECKFRYVYQVIYGNDFLVMIRDHPTLIAQYFPKYHEYITTPRTS